MNKKQPEPIPQNEQMALLSQFGESREKNEIVEVLKELFDLDKIELITDLEPDEIKLVTAINVCAGLKNIPSWKTGTDLYMKLLLSKNRKSRREIIDAIKGHAEKLRGLKNLMRPMGRY